MGGWPVSWACRGVSCTYTVSCHPIFSDHCKHHQSVQLTLTRLPLFIMPSELRLGALLFAAVKADETSLMQDVKKSSKRNETKYQHWWKVHFVSIMSWVICLLLYVLFYFGFSIYFVAISVHLRSCFRLPWTSWRASTRRRRLHPCRSSQLLSSWIRGVQEEWLIWWRDGHDPSLLFELAFGRLGFWL